MKKTSRIKKFSGIICNTTLFSCAFIAAELLAASPFIHLVIAPYLKFFLVWGMVIVVFNVVGDYRKFLNKYYFILVLFAICYGITIVLNRNHNFGSNLKSLMYMFLIFLAVFDYGLKVNRRRIIYKLKAIFITFGITSFILATASFMTYLLSLKGHTMYNGQWVYYGMFENRLWGLYNPSTGSAINTIAILMMLGYWALFKPRKVVRVTFVIALAVHYSCLLLTNSRTALFTLILGIGLLILFCGRLLNNVTIHKCTLKKFLYQLGIALGCCIFIWLSVAPIRGALSYAPGAVRYVEHKLGIEQSNNLKNKVTKENLTRLEELEDRPGGVLTGRTVLWKAGLQTFVEDPIFGVTRENLPERVEKNLDDDYWVRDLQRGGLHNIFITVLVSSGIVGFILFIAFILILVIKCVHFVLYGISEHRNIILVLITILAIILIMECLESRILYQVSIFYVLFWSIASLVLSLIDTSGKDAMNED